jgi:AcrR family transcriptional regulator
MVSVIEPQTPAHRERWSGKERRAQVAAVTLEIIAREGVHAASLGRIAEAAGITAPSLLGPHGDPRSRFGPAPRARGGLDRLLHQSQYARAAARDRGAVHESRIGADREWVITPLFELTTAARAEGLTEHMGRNQLAVLQRFVDIVEKGKRQGTIRRDADPEVVGWSLMSLGWAKDFALLQGLAQFIDKGTADRVLDNILSAVAAK